MKLIKLAKKKLNHQRMNEFTMRIGHAVSKVLDTSITAEEQLYNEILNDLFAINTKWRAMNPPKKPGKPRYDLYWYLYNSIYK